MRNKVKENPELFKEVNGEIRPIQDPPSPPVGQGGTTNKSERKYRAHFRAHFRAQRVCDRKWVYGTPVESMNGKWYMVFGATEDAVNTMNEVDFYFIEIISETIGQFIITEDKQDIYENDIIEETLHGKKIREFIAKDIRTFTREYDRARHSSVWIIIGNTHEEYE